MHPAGEAQADFGEALAVIGGVECMAHYLAIDLPHSDDCLVIAFPDETTEALLEGHVRAFAYFGGVPTRILNDNTKSDGWNATRSMALCIDRHWSRAACRGGFAGFGTPPVALERLELSADQQSCWSLSLSGWRRF